MSEYQRWAILNEALGFPLGVRSANNLGLGGFQAFEEKKKKMDVGDEIPADIDDEDEEEEDDDEEEDEGEEKEVKDKLQDKKPVPDPKVGECPCGEKHDPKMCKKAKKNLKNENMFANYDDCHFDPLPEIGTPEYRDAFLKSLEGHMGSPNKRHFGGVNLEEEVIFAPRDEQSVLPQPGQPGFAPVAPVGQTQATQTQSKPDWEQQWMPVEAMHHFLEQWENCCKK